MKYLSLLDTSALDYSGFLTNPTISTLILACRYLKQASVPLNEFEFSWAKVSNIQPQLEKLISKNYFLNLSAKEAYKVLLVLALALAPAPVITPLSVQAYVRAYESHSLKQIYNVQSLCLKSVGQSFGFVVPPHIDIGVAASFRQRPRKEQSDRSKNFKKTKIFRQGGGGGGGKFSKH